MKDQDFDKIKSALQKLLPEAIERAVASYEIFADQTPPEDPKKFSAHHSACKSALSHLDYLTKLAKWVETNSNINPSNNASLEPLIIEARELLIDYDLQAKKAKHHEND